jgi:hypothetical protein
MNYGRLTVHDELEMSICPGLFEVYLNKSVPIKPINWLISELVQITTWNSEKNLEILSLPGEHCLL